MSLEFFKDRIEKAQRVEFKRQKKWDKELTAVPSFEHFNFGDLGTAIFAIGTTKQARQFYEGYLEYVLAFKRSKSPISQKKAEGLVRSNIGWFFGEGMAKKRIDMWNEACEATHPVFGTVMPGPAEALKKGLEMGRRLRSVSAAR